MENSKQYFIKGDSSDKTLVFVHGSGCNKNFLLPLAKEIRKYDCLIIDLPGHGDNVEKTYSLERYTEYVLDICKDYNNVILIGHSLGGTIILNCLSTVSEGIIGGIGISTGAKFYKGFDEEFLNLIHNRDTKVLEALPPILGHIDNPAVADVISNGGLDSDLVSLFEDFNIDEVVDIEGNLKNIKVPTLLMTGLNDILVYPEYSYRISELMSRDCYIKEYDGFMHMLPIANKDIIAKDIIEFVNSL